MEFDSVFPLYQDWEVLSLGEVCRRGGGNVQTGPFGSQLHASDYVAEGIPSVMPQNIGDNRILDTGIARITEADAQRLSKYRIREGDIIYSRRGDVERRALVRKAEDGWLCGTGCLRIRFGKGVIYPRYAAYYLGHPAVREWIVRHAHGATMPNLNTTILSELPFVLPPWTDQVSIGDAIELYDQKIDLNRRINQTLEAMAQAIFKSWFVDFDPVKAKIAAIEQGEDPLRAVMRAISGKTDAELDQMPREHHDQLVATAVLFPDAMQESELGEIPLGWKVVPASALIEFNPKEPLRKGTVAPYLDMASLPTSGSWAESPVPREFGSGMRFRNGDALLARITPCLENGKSAFVQNLPDESVGWGSTEFIVMRSKKPVPQEYAYLLARHAAFREHTIRSMTGTSGRQRAQADTVAEFKVISPSESSVWCAFSELLGSCFKAIKFQSEASETLAELRDTLLPKLLSGELSVANIESMR